MWGVVGLFLGCGTPAPTVEAVPAPAVANAPTITPGTVPFLGADTFGATSAFPMNGQAYAPLLAIDGNRNTGWIYRGPAMFQFPEATVRGFGLTPGLAKTQELFEKNGRPTKIRFRFWTRGPDDAASAADWHEVLLPLVDQLSPDPVEFPCEPLAKAVAVELEVLDGVAGRDYPDWFIADVVVRGDLAGVADTSGSTWRYAAPMPTFATSDAATAPFATLDLSACVAKYPDGRSFSGECVKARRGYLLTGVETGPAGSLPVERRVRVQEYGPCYALIDDFPYTRVSCDPTGK